MNQSLLWRSCSLILLTVLYPILPALSASEADVSIAFDKESYCITELATITVIDPAMNLENSAIDVVEVRAWSSADKGGFIWPLHETSFNSGVFRDPVAFITAEMSHIGFIAKEDDMIFAKYMNMTASSVISGKSIEPIKRMQITNATIYDAYNGNVMAEFNGPKIIQADLENMQCRKKQTFLFIVQIENPDGYTVFLSWIKSTLESNQSAEAAIQWMPKTSGDFTVEIFVWDSLHDPQPLSEVARIQHNVT